MKLETFLTKHVFSGKNYPGTNLLIKRDSRLEEYKALTETFIFPCNIKKNSCTGHPELKHLKGEQAKCCCYACAKNIGYLENIRPVNKPGCNSLRDILTGYASLFSAINGFWRPGKGCILPRHMRSLTCITYICLIEDKFVKENGKTANQFRACLRAYYDRYLLKENRAELKQLYNKITARKEGAKTK